MKILKKALQFLEKDKKKKHDKATLEELILSLKKRQKELKELYKQEKDPARTEMYRKECKALKTLVIKSRKGLKKL